MKNYKYIVFVFLCFISLISFKVVAQQTTDIDKFIINQYYQLNKNASGLNKNIAGTRLQNQDNAIKFNQVGNNNQLYIKSNINDAQIVNQIGNNNEYQFINYYSNLPSNFNIVQQGNANSLQIYGENSIINNISIVQKTNFKSLIIKNY